MIWKILYGHSSRDRGTLGHFRSLLNRTKTVKKDCKKAVDANLEFLEVVFKGHLLASACRILGIAKLDSTLQLPQDIRHGSAQQQLVCIRSLATQVVEECTLIDTCGDIADTDDHVYNYTRVLCHYSALVYEFQNACTQGDGDRVFRCWRIMLPHFLASGRTKYSLEALRLQFQVKAILSPQLSHQVLWDRFVNTRGGLGRNIQHDLYNEHVNRLVKSIIVSMGPNLTETALQRAARCVSTLHAVCKQFDKESGVPVTTCAHSTRSDAGDIGRVTSAVLKSDLLTMHPGRSHSSFLNMKLNPLFNWNRGTTLTWIEKKKEQYSHEMVDEGTEEDSDDNNDEDDSDSDN